MTLDIFCSCSSLAGWLWTSLFNDTEPQFLIRKMALIKIPSLIISLGCCVRIRWDNEYIEHNENTLQTKGILHKSPVRNSFAYGKNSSQSWDKLVGEFHSSSFSKAQTKKRISFLLYLWEVSWQTLSGMDWWLIQIKALFSSHSARVWASHPFRI